MFGPAFQPSECLKALLYFKGSDLADLSQADRDVLIAAVGRVDEIPKVKLLDRDLSVLDRK